MYKEESIALIYFDTNQQNYQINHQAIEIIKSFPAPLGVVSIVGMYRTGKSYLINRMMLNRQKGFGVGPSVNPCTKGLWMWGSPIQGQKQDGTPINILVIDTEGIGALDEDSNHDTRIFSLAILLSSFFIYNSVGSIDENAIQNLSLVISLTKHIQISQSEHEIEDYSNYFPQFLWIVRDFTLQLVDQNGDQITAKDYLENALRLQNGFSDDIEQKNRIRRLIQTFFQDRDCFTMIRPMVDEVSLQNLENLQLNQLRHEFNEQIIQLRKKFIFGMKPKVINNQELSGEMFSQLVHNYINSINNGIIPNIENSWQYVCRDENQKCLETAQKFFIDEINNTNLPKNEIEIKTIYKQIKNNSIQLFNKKAIGDELQPYIDELKLFQQKLKTNFFLKNQELSNKISQNYVEFEYQTINQQLQNNNFNNIDKYHNGIQEFISILKENGPQLENCDKIYLSFILNQSQQGSLHFINQFKNQISVSKQKINDLEIQICQKEEQINIIQLQIQQNQIQQQLDQKNLQDQLINQDQLDIKFQNQLKDNQNQIKNLNFQLEEMTDLLKEKERNYLMDISDFDKEKALLIQKIQFQEQNFEEYLKKESDLNNQISVQKQEIQEQLKDSQKKLETSNQQLKQQNKELSEKNNDFQINNQLLLEQSTTNQQNVSKEKQLMMKQIADLTTQNQKLKQDYDQQDINYQKSIELLNQNYQNSKDEFFEKQSQQQVQHKSSEEDLRLNFQNSQNQIAILQQKLQFKQLQIDENQAQVADIKKQHEITITALQYKNSENKIDNSIILTLKEKQSKEIKLLQSLHDDLKKKLNQQIFDISQKNNDLEFRQKILIADNLKQVNTLNEALQQAEQQINNQNINNKILEGQLSNGVNEADTRAKKQIQQMQKEIDELKSKEREQIRNFQEKTEFELKDLRAMYDEEKSKIEKRLQDEKLKYDQRSKQLTDEFDLKFKEENSSLEEEIENYKNQLQQLQISQININQNFKNEIEIKNNQIAIHDKTIKDMKTQLDQFEAQFESQITQLKNQNTEKKNQLKRMLDLKQHEIIRTEKEIKLQKQQLEDQETKLKILEENNQTKIKQQQEEFQKLQLNLYESQNLSKEQNDQIQQQLLISEKNLILANQQIKYLNNKILENQDFQEKTNKSIEKNFENQIQEIQEELNQKLTKTQIEKDNQQQKNKQLKKQYKINDQLLLEKNTELEKERLINQEYHYQSEQKLADIENKFQLINFELQQKIEQYKQILQDEHQPLYQDIEKLKITNEKLENEKAEFGSLYERILWEQKFIFLSNQKDQAKKEYDDAIKKFDQTIQHFQTIKKNSEADIHQNLGDNLYQIEKKYQNKIQDMQETHENEIENLEDKIKLMEKELLNVKDRIQLTSNVQISSHFQNDKKYNEMMENEKKLITELNQLKKNEDKSLKQFYKSIEKEKNLFKSKVFESEALKQEDSSLAGSVIIDNEKQRVLWNQEDNLIDKQKFSVQENFATKKGLSLKNSQLLKQDMIQEPRSIKNINLMHSQKYGSNAKGNNIDKIRASNLMEQQLSQQQNLKQSLYGNYLSKSLFKDPINNVQKIVKKM